MHKFIKTKYACSVIVSRRRYYRQILTKRLSMKNNETSRFQLFCCYNENERCL